MVDTVRVEPMDRYNEALVGNVHPPGWVNPVPAGRYNLVVVGAGTAGLVTAAITASLGARVAPGGAPSDGGRLPERGVRAVQEHHSLGARAAAEGLEADGFGIRATSGGSAPARADGADFGAVMERMRRLRSSISSNDAAGRYRDLGVDVYLGEARFTGRGTLSVEGRTLTFRKAVIATGARAVQPVIEGLAETRVS